MRPNLVFWDEHRSLRSGELNMAATYSHLNTSARLTIGAIEATQVAGEALTSKRPLMSGRSVSVVSTAMGRMLSLM